ncbi:MAG: hypothetical protein JSU07_09735 [Bacteroidetes bacterium]|nr:hypothetical protein [Bacteroidota bacterium]
MIKIKKRKLLYLKRKAQKLSSVFLALLLLVEVSYPTQVFALTGGPSQPEVQSFEPVGTSDMVDLFSGDFNYNLPLLDVEGYPINIAYHSGVNTDQEASWVGLGWNINPGVINRNMRGLPDDFAGDVVKKDFNMKPNKTWGVAANVGIELFGSNKIGLGLGGSYGFNFNNYTGPSVIKSFNVNISAGLGGGNKLNAGLGLTSSSDEGLTVQPSLGFSKKMSSGGNTETSLGVSIGTAFNSRGGLKQLTIGTSASMSVKGDYMKNGSNKRADTKSTITDAESKDYSQTSGSLGSQGASGTFNFGQQTYTPKIDMPMKNFSMSGSFTLGGELWGVHGKVGLSGFYSAQQLAQTTLNNPAYGYLYTEQGQFNDNALMDFNREKDGTFTENTPALPLTNLTFDTYGVSGQGIGGSYRPFRGDVGYVFDNQSYTTTDNDALTAEVGLGGYVHVGTNVTVIDVLSNSGKWKSDNAAISTMISTSKGNGNDFENVYFKEANEKAVDSDPTFYNQIGQDNPVRFDVNFGKFNHAIKNGFVNQYNQTFPFSGPITRKNRDKKTQNISFIKKSEYNRFAVDSSYSNILSSNAQPHHIAEVTTLGTDGSRYIYGVAAYNNKQREITFSVGSTLIASHTGNSDIANAANRGLVKYLANTDNSSSNPKGIDNYYSNTETPAYAHSYLLTSVLTPDYIDADNIRGPSDNDYGGYTKFKYKKISNYKWRVPIEKDSATYTEGLKSDFTDDKANIIYGEKDIYYLDSVITKNYIAVFHKSNRDDALGAMDVNGGTDPSIRQLKLDSISLYSKRDLKTPLKRVHFEYTYALCTKLPNQVSTTLGKLTLKKIYFTYQNSNQARLSPYTFDYHESISAENPNYNVKAYDRWGNYKPNNASTIGVRTYPGAGDASSFIGSAPLPPSDYPYVEQDRTVEDVYSAVWNLKEIHLPSGGTIKVSYEADDYAYVQNKQAGEMFKVVDYKPTTTGVDQTNSTSPIDIGTTSNGKLFFKLHNNNTNIADYVKGLTNIYFRFLMNIRTDASGKPHLEYVSGYGQIVGYGYDASSNLGWIQLQDVSLNDSGLPMVNPIVKTSVQFGRLHLPKVVWDATNGSFSGTLSGSILSAMINASFIKNIRDAVAGPNAALYNSPRFVGRGFIAGKSWIRLNNPDGHKLGGGSRVKKIALEDDWQNMVGVGNGDISSYGQEYSYNLDDGKSSGVAAYEPQLGGDENSFRQPIFVSTKKLMVPDDESYVEEPFGESFFPSASVGYSQVTVKNLQRTGVKRHATGKVVHEFYTAKDFPTITKRTNVKFRRGKDGPGSLRSLLKINVRDYFAATQGFAIELNDMHGKPKSQKVYQEAQNTPITSVEYKYKSDNYLNGSFKLRNDCQVVDKDGTVSSKNIGMFFDMVGDFREAKTETKSTTIEINVDVIPVLGYPVPIPGIWPGFAKDKSRFRSATLTKVVQRFGILEETVAKDLGSIVSTKNVAYDSETGDVLLTQTTTNYNDKVYTFKYPAWWYYDNMGPAYQNLGFEQNLVVFAGGYANIPAAYLFKEGDEVMCKKNFFSTNSFVAWVDAVSPGQIKLVKKDGSVVSGNYDIRIIRSGKRNNLTTDMATISTLNDPLASLSSNSYQNVLQASAIEFTNARKTHCDCISSNTSLPSTVNPYIKGTKGTWRALKSYTHLTKRSQTVVNNNTNIRKDGVYESYSPYYKLNAGSWQKDPNNWTYVSEVSEFNVFGQEVENKDALARYSSATFGYNQTMALSVAANSRFKEQGFDGFEDYRYNPCVDDHFKFSGNDTSKLESHTGRYSIKVVSGTPKVMSKQINSVCTPTPDCSINLVSVLVPSTTTNNVTASGGSGNYNFSWVILSGGTNNPQISFTAGNVIQITSTGPYSIKVTVTDDKNCSQILIVNAN